MSKSPVEPGRGRAQAGGAMPGKHSLLPLLIVACGALCVALASVPFAHPRLRLFSHMSLRYAAALTNGGYVLAGVPFIMRDDYATQMCVSSRAGRLLPPLVLPPEPFSSHVTHIITYMRVRAWVPFMVQDGKSMQLCISSKGGDAFLPFLAPRRSSAATTRSRPNRTQARAPSLPRSRADTHAPLQRRP